MAIKANFSRGILNASGDKLDNAITFSRDLAGALFVNNGAVPIKGAAPTVSNTDLIQASGSAGNDTISLDETNGPLPRASLSGGAGDDTLIGGSAGDLLSGGAGLDTFVWDAGDGNDVIEGGSNGLSLLGVDKLFVNGDAANETISLSAIGGGRVSLSRDVVDNLMDANLDVNDVECIFINPLDGSDAIVINDLSGTDVLAVRIDLASTLGGTAGDSQVDTVTINGSNGDDSFTLHGSTGSVGIGTPAGDDTFRIDHAEVSDQLVINTFAGDDTINAGGASPPGQIIMTLTIDAGGGNDIITSSRGADTLTGGDGADTFRYGNVGYLAADTITDFGAVDIIDLAAIDANIAVPGEQAFAWGGTTPTPNAVWYEESGGNTIVYADANGDTTPGFQITLLGSGLGLTAADFIL